MPQQTIPNNNYSHGGRFGNIFFTGMALHFISIKNHLNSQYKEHDKFQKLGIELYVGPQTYSESVELKDYNFFRLITGDVLWKNITIDNSVWCQTKEFAYYLRDYFNLQYVKNKVIEHNTFKDRYQNNQDV